MSKTLQTRLMTESWAVNLKPKRRETMKEIVKLIEQYGAYKAAAGRKITHGDENGSVECFDRADTILKRIKYLLTLREVIG